MTFAKNTRVQLIQGSEENDIPDGSLGTVVDVFPDDDDMMVVLVDCRPNLKLHYWSNEIGIAIKEFVEDLTK